MTLFVVVTRNKRDGKEYLLDDAVEGYVELSDAQKDADSYRTYHGEAWETYVGKVVPVES